MDGQPNIVAGYDASTIEGSVDTPLSRRKMLNNESPCTSEMASYFLRKKVMVLIILIRWSTRITWWWLWNTPTNLYCWWKGKNCEGRPLNFIRSFDLSIGINWQVTLSTINWRRQKQSVLLFVLSFPMTFGCPGQHRRFFQWRHIIHIWPCKVTCSHWDAHHNINWWR